MGLGGGGRTVSGKGLLAQVGAPGFNYRAGNEVKIALEVQLGLQEVPPHRHMSHPSGPSPALVPTSILTKGTALLRHMWCAKASDSGSLEGCPHHQVAHTEWHPQLYLHPYQKAGLTHSHITCARLWWL